MNLSFSFGFCTRDDSDGAWMTINSLLAHHKEYVHEIIVIDNSPEGSKHAQVIKEHVTGINLVKYIRAIGPESSCLYKERLFQVATGDVVVCCDSHVIYDEGSIKALVDYFNSNPETNDLIMGPCLHRAGTILGTNQAIYEKEGYALPENVDIVNGVVWRGGACGVWVIDHRGTNHDNPPFEIMQQGTGAFACRRLAWPSFHPSFIGHGGNETFLMESFRQKGAKVLCLPSFRWIHKFIRVNGAPYSLSWDHRVKNYLIGFNHLLRQDLYDSAIDHLKKHCPQTTEKIKHEIPRPNDLIADFRQKLNTRPQDVHGQIPDALFYQIKKHIKPQHYTLEFGSGLSTLLFDHIKTNHTSIEHDQNWFNKISPLLNNSNYIYSNIENDWYDWRPEHSDQFDIILIDGPPGNKYNRAGCLHYLADIMAPNVKIFIDDTQRDKDALLANDIENMYGFSSVEFNQNGRKFKLLTREVDISIYNEGVGDELEKIIKNLFNIEPLKTCGCRGRIREMNYRGIKWCNNNIETITSWLLDGASKWSADQNGIIKIWSEFSPDFLKKTFLQKIIKQAIYNYEKLK